MSSTPSGSRHRKLAFVYDPKSFSAMSIAESAVDICDLLWVIDTNVPGTDSMARLLRRFGETIDVASLSCEAAADAVAVHSPDGVLALADSRLLWTAEVARHLELPFFSPEVAASLTDKYAQRAALHAGGLPVPGFWTVPEVSDGQGWDRLRQSVAFPAVLKPRSGEGSRDTVPVASLDQVWSIVADASADPQRSGQQLIIEEYLPDRPDESQRPFAGYVSVESIVSDGRASHLAITGRFPPAEPFRETGFFVPSALDAVQRDAALRVASHAAQALGVTIGCLHTEIKFTPAGPRVIEVNGRIGGGIPEMLAAASGVRLLPIALQVALGDVVSFDATAACNQVAWLLYVQAPRAMTRVISIDGLERLQADPSVREIILNRGPGQTVDWREGNHGHVFSVFGVSPDHATLQRLEHRLHEEVTIRGT